ncbi:MAG TPA: serine/threonine-protein kinase, partial [Vicinamibacterales bacterium]|nr:serine/threonine-protein kinase [Vicinamibacterales bacterium]
MQPIAHYNILERLGIGALGDVYRARDLKVGRTVALMEPPPDLTAAPGARERFIADARAAAALNHPNIATLWDVVEQDGRCYLAYEFAAGPSLRDEMGGRAVNMRRAIEIAAQISDALAEGHSRGLIHGDLRPENVVVTPKGSVKILNFGLTRWTVGGRARAAAAQAGGITDDPYGIAPYLSPEQAVGTTLDERSDLFSFGVILYEMLTGRNPFTAATPAATVVNVVRMPAPPLSSVPAELSSLVARTLSKSVDGRPRNALTLSSELRRISADLDAKEGNPSPTELIPVAPKQSNAWLFAALAAIV